MSEKPSPPKVRGDLDWTTLDLDPEEGFVLSRIDGASGMDSLSHVTGLTPGRISTILAKLSSQGALVEPFVVAPSLADRTTEDGGTADDIGPDDDDSDAVAPEVETNEDDDDNEGEESEDDQDEDAEEDAEVAESDYRRVYIEKFRELDSDERVRLAQTARGSSLCALCFDPDHRVIAAVLENGRVTQKHGRLIAKHHRTASGLDKLGRVIVFLRDRTTQRFLVRNPQLSDALFRKMMANKRMLEAFHMTTNREATEKVRRTARKVFRTKFQTAPPEEKVQLLMTSEGRCLPQLIGLSFDGRTTALMCGRTIHSTLLIQNLTRFPGTPPALLSQMARSPIVKRMPQLRANIRQHPNCPAGLKRQLT